MGLRVPMAEAMGWIASPFQGRVHGGAGFPRAKRLFSKRSDSVVPVAKLSVGGGSASIPHGHRFIRRKHAVLPLHMKTGEAR